MRARNLLRHFQIIVASQRSSVKQQSDIPKEQQPVVLSNLSYKNKQCNNTVKNNKFSPAFRMVME